MNIFSGTRLWGSDNGSADEWGKVLKNDISRVIVTFCFFMFSTFLAKKYENMQKNDFTRFEKFYQSIP